MTAVPIRTWNALCAVGVGILFILLSLLVPEWHKREAELQCLPEYKVQAVYPDMIQCGKAMQAAPSDTCRCNRPQNPWAGVYVNLVVPLLVGLIASLLFVGSTLAKIALVNASVWGAILSLGLVYAVIKPVLIVGLAFSFGAFLYVALVASVIVGTWTAVGAPTIRRGRPGVT